MAKYIGRMAKRGNVCTLIMMVMKAMYSRTLMKPGRQGDREWQVTRLGGQGWGRRYGVGWSRLLSPVNSSV